MGAILALYAIDEEFLKGLRENPSAANLAQIKAVMRAMQDTSVDRPIFPDYSGKSFQDLISPHQTGDLEPTRVALCAIYTTFGFLAETIQINSLAIVEFEEWLQQLGLTDLLRAEIFPYNGARPTFGFLSRSRVIDTRSKLEPRLNEVDHSNHPANRGRVFGGNHNEPEQEDLIAEDSKMPLLPLIEAFEEAQWRNSAIASIWV